MREHSDEKLPALLLMLMCGRRERLRFSLMAGVKPASVFLGFFLTSDSNELLVGHCTFLL